MACDKNRPLSRLESLPAEILIFICAKLSEDAYIHVADLIPASKADRPSTIPARPVIDRTRLLMMLTCRRLKSAMDAMVDILPTTSISPRLVMRQDMVCLRDTKISRIESYTIEESTVCKCTTCLGASISYPTR